MYQLSTDDPYPTDTALRYRAVRIDNQYIIGTFFITQKELLQNTEYRIQNT
eukprot:COSAG02_NODE_3739_length_6303_cov_12.797228_10_plen_50_part_01